MGASNPNARACSDLLSREAFPLHTLNNHPIAPVLLRMMQLNTFGGVGEPFPMLQRRATGPLIRLLPRPPGCVARPRLPPPPAGPPSAPMPSSATAPFLTGGQTGSPPAQKAAWAARRPPHTTGARRAGCMVRRKGGAQRPQRTTWRPLLLRLRVRAARTTAHTARPSSQHVRSGPGEVREGGGGDRECGRGSRTGRRRGRRGRGRCVVRGEGVGTSATTKRRQRPQPPSAAP